MRHRGVRIRLAEHHDPGTWHGCVHRCGPRWLPGTFAVTVFEGDPAWQEATYFGVYEISERGTSWIGPQIFALVVASTGSYRDAILSLMARFVTGTIMLFLTDIRQAEADVLELAASTEPA